MIDGIILIAGLPVHASEPLHCLHGDKVTAVFVLNLFFLGASPSFVIWRTTDVGPPVYAAMVPGSS